MALGTATVANGTGIMYTSMQSLGKDLREFRKASASRRVTNSSKNESPVWKSFENVKGKDRKTSGHSKNKKFYEWDHTHNDIEVYDYKGKHVGSMDPTTGKMYKPAEVRSIEI